jgi:hypothetical protein
LHQPQIIQTKNVVGVFVRVQNRVGDADLFAQQLLSQVRWCVNQYIARRQAQYQTATSAAITRVIAGADSAVATNGWHADRGASAKEDQLAGNITS